MIGRGSVGGCHDKLAGPIGSLTKYVAAGANFDPDVPGTVSVSDGLWVTATCGRGGGGGRAPIGTPRNGLGWEIIFSSRCALRGEERGGDMDCPANPPTGVERACLLRLRGLSA